ncbi:MAG TPA: calcium-binding protein, partial [Mycoplana sp.]|nr:calcium-binding protein [Mycoplana sp.]
MAFLPDFAAATFGTSTTITNPYFPLPPGTINSYGAAVIDPDTGGTDTERNDHFATFDTKVIDGVKALVVRDTAYANGALIEDTLDWYAQDDGGNVWYLGEISASYNYNDHGKFIGAEFEGSWQTGVAGGKPGWIMRATPVVGDSYLQEFFAGVAEDEGKVIATDLHVDTKFGSFDKVVKILDTSALEPGVGAYKYYAPGVGVVLEEELVFSQKNPELVSEIQNRREVDISAAVDPTQLAFEGKGASKTVTFLGEDGSTKGAIGAYSFDPKTGEIGEARILFADTAELKDGAKAQVNVATGQSLGLFLIPNVEHLGLDLKDFKHGGLFFRTLTGGDVADLYDGNNATTFTPGKATIFDQNAPVVTDEKGNLLPIQAFHSVGNRDGFNFLNPVAGENAHKSDIGSGQGIEVVAFEDGLATTKSFDKDFNDAFVAVTDAAINGDTVGDLVDATDISRKVGTDGRNRLIGTGDDDQLIALGGKDLIVGRGGNDQIEAGSGNDLVIAGKGGDLILGEAGRDRLFGCKGDDTIQGGAGRDGIFGGSGNDALSGDGGNDRINGGGGFDDTKGGEGSDQLMAGPGGARMSGGAGDDLMFGSAAKDVFVFDLVPFGKDVIHGFEDGIDHIE